MSQTEIKNVLSEKKIYAFILSGHIPINPDACMFDFLDFLTSVLMLKPHEGRSRKVGIRKTALLDILYELLTRRKQMQNKCFAGCMCES